MERKVQVEKDDDATQPNKRNDRRPRKIFTAITPPPKECVDGGKHEWIFFGNRWICEVCEIQYVQG